jgi:hypothetical protein
MDPTSVTARKILFFLLLIDRSLWTLKGPTGRAHDPNGTGPMAFTLRPLTCRYVQSPSRVVSVVLALWLVLLLPSTPEAHEVPASVTVFAFVKPEGQRLRLVMRVPLQSMRDMEIPQRGPGYLDMALVAPELRNAAHVWIAEYIQVFEGERALGDPQIVAARISLPSDRTFETYERALGHAVGAPHPNETDIPWQQALLDVVLEYPIRSDTSEFSIRPELAHLGLSTTTVLRYLPPTSGERVYRYDGNPGLVRLDPRWHHSALRFVDLGFRHILDGIDHLLFVFCLVIPFRKPRPLVLIVTSFTVAHSITLAASAMGLAPNALWFPPFIETLIALSILYMAFENIIGPKLERRWIIAFVFGLVHGFGFSFLLRDSLQFAGSHLFVSLLAFNVGVELGQLLVLALAIPVLTFLFRRVVAERVGTIILSALVAHSAWHWMTERWSALREYEFQWPAFDLALAARVTRWLMLLLIVTAAVWLLRGFFRRVAGREQSAESTAGAG